ncbi:MAG: hypothetical protein EA397_19115 [Deltaproteobacteria bacterium]|nr:MAG: hypothetical protein EA397_19115 [Deltaproteobacteria bacterium]
MSPSKKRGPRVPGSQHLSKQAYQREIERQALSSFTRNPFGREVYRWYTRWRTGALLRPRYVIGAIVAVMGFLAMACMGCFGAVGVWIGLQ